MERTLLALDTSTERMALALTWPGGRLSCVEAGGAAASARLIPAALELLARAGIGFDQLDGIAFGAGPGAFTGLRTSCAVAQGFGCALGRPLWPLDSLMLVAEDAATQRQLDGTLWVAMDARMDEAYAAAYRRTDAGWQVLEPPALYTLPALIERLRERPPDWLAGSALAAFGDRLSPPRIGSLPYERDRGAALASLACRAAARQPPLDAAEAVPLYLRDKVALTTGERARLAAARA
jgi:tRNA threonylcarbamoyladenosine biosynthesis protein TsaB